MIAAPSWKKRCLLALPVCLLVVGLAGCDPFGFASEPSGGSLEQSLAKAIKVEGRVKCAPYPKRNLQICDIEGDPGSGWSGQMHLKVGRDGCWRARYVRYHWKRGFTGSRPDLSYGRLRAYGRTRKGCFDT